MKLIWGGMHGAQSAETFEREYYEIAKKDQISASQAN